MVWISFCGGGSCKFRVTVTLLADVAARLTLVPNLYKRTEILFGPPTRITCNLVYQVPKWLLHCYVTKKLRNGDQYLPIKYTNILRYI